MSNKKKSKKKLLSKRNGIVLIVLLAVLILIVNIVTMSYSWYEPAVKSSTGVKYLSDVQIRSEECEIIGTYAATAENSRSMADKTGVLAYDDTSITTATIPANQIWYFETVIANNNQTSSSNVSLYLKNIPAGAGLGVAYPSNSYHVFTEAKQDVCIVRNAHIFGNQDDDYSKLKIDWFIKTDGNSVTVNFDNSNNQIYISYN